MNMNFYVLAKACPISSYMLSLCNFQKVADLENNIKEPQSSSSGSPQISKGKENGGSHQNQSNMSSLASIESSMVSRTYHKLT